MEVTSKMVETALAVFLGEKPENIGQIDRAMNKALAAVLAIVEGTTPEQKRERAAQLLREANEQEGYDVQ